MCLDKHCDYIATNRKYIFLAADGSLQLFISCIPFIFTLTDVIVVVKDRVQKVGQVSLVDVRRRPVLVEDVIARSRKVRVQFHGEHNELCAPVSCLGFQLLQESQWVFRYVAKLHGRPAIVEGGRIY